MTHSEYEAFLERVAEEAYHCQYGHMQCSDRKGGPCSDEEFQYHDEEDE